MAITYVWIYLITFIVLCILAAAVFILWIYHSKDLRRKRRAQKETLRKAD